MQILLVYEMVPERTQIYNLCISEEDGEKVLKCHGHLANLIDTPPDLEDLLAVWLPKFLVQFKPVFDTDSKEDQPPFLIPGTRFWPAVVSGTQVVLSGFML